MPTATVVGVSRRKPRWPGNAEIVCTNRGRHDPRLLRTLQLIRDSTGTVRVTWNPRQGPAPETGFHAQDGLKTLEFRCQACGRHPKVREDKFTEACRGLAVLQEVTGNTPIVLDVSML